MTNQPQNSRPQKFMDFAPRARSIDGMRRPDAAPRSDAAPRPAPHSGTAPAGASPRPAQRPASAPRPTPKPAQNSAQRPASAPRPALRVATTTVKAETHETTVIVPKAPVRPTIKDRDNPTPLKPVIKDHDEPTPVTVKSETVSAATIFTSREDNVIEIEEETPRRPERHGIIAQLEESSDFGLLGDNIIETKETPKNVFINTDKVDKRPLGAAPATPLKNLYKKPAPKPIKDNVPTVVTAAPDKKNSITLIIAALLTIVLGGVVGTFIYLAFFQ